MTRFSASDLETIDSLWRSVPADHVWTGWSATGDEPDEVTLYRTRAHWRRFPLRKSNAEFVLFDDKGTEVARSRSPKQLLQDVEAIPGLTI
ncbi:MAG: hypothetical protein JJ931_00290 [Henriciella sp.]|jgi:hypothetical protein|nr:hypothetical protein [Henriciella sp.]MBO6693834.1 hypothetical protein [Henriciella sp.]